jgi:hypothetical protein
MRRTEDKTSVRNRPHAKPRRYLFLVLDSGRLPRPGAFRPIGAFLIPLMILVAGCSEEPTPPPDVTSVSPQSGPSVGGTAITISGSNILDGATADIGGSSCTNYQYVYFDPNSWSVVIQCDTPSGQPGIHSLRVVNPDGQSDVLNTAFSFIAPPTITNISPTSGNDMGGTHVTITGSEFDTGSLPQVNFGSQPAANVSVVSSTEIQCDTPWGPLGPVDVIVTNPDNQCATLPYGFTYTDSIAPAAISDLRASTGSSPGEVDLTWTATGDDGNVGSAASYTIKYASFQITASNFDSATTFPLPWWGTGPLDPGQTETYTITGLPTSQQYWFAIKVSDNALNVSPISNVPTGEPPWGQAQGWIGGAANGWRTSSGTSSAWDYQSFDFPTDVSIDANGNIYVVSQSSHRIAKWNSTGNAVGWIGGGQDGWRTDTVSASAISRSDYRSFDFPCDVYVHSSGEIYVADYNNSRISKWSAGGNAIGWIGGGVAGWQTGIPPAPGSGTSSFNRPVGVIVSSDGTIYVCDGGNYRVCKWSSSGTAIGWIGGGQDGWRTGSGASRAWGYRSFYAPMDVFLDSSGSVYVPDSTWGESRVSKWSSSGSAIGWIGGGFDGWQTGASSSSGPGYKYFDNPSAVYVGNGGTIYIADALNNRISKWNSSGSAIGWIGGGSDYSRASSGTTFGSDYQSFSRAFGVCGDGAGFIFIADGDNDRVCKWTD